MADAMPNIEIRLRHCGLRPTRQRVALADLLFAKGDRHLTVEELHAEATEAGVPVFEVIGFYAFFAPAKTPPAIIAKFNADTVKALADPVIRQRIVLAPGAYAVDVEHEIDWHEQQKLLKLGFGFDVHADNVAAETQFGHLYRPTHTNTSWEDAKFETCAHRFVHVGEPGYGVAVTNDSTYG